MFVVCRATSINRIIIINDINDHQSPHRESFVNHTTFFFSQKLTDYRYFGLGLFFMLTTGLLTVVPVSQLKEDTLHDIQSRFQLLSQRPFLDASIFFNLIIDVFDVKVD